jgi:hypothetical protein
MTIFALVQHHKYSIKEIEDLIPYERDLYFTFLMSHLNKLEDTTRNA